MGKSGKLCLIWIATFLMAPRIRAESREALVARMTAERELMRARIRARSHPRLFEEMDPSNAVEDFLGGPEGIIRSLAEMSTRELRAGKVEKQPWSSTYWPMTRGIIANRYADPEYGHSDDWARNYAYVRERPAFAIASTRDSEAINKLSPAEKYDLLVGDAQGTLTRLNWARGLRYMQTVGRVEPWMGICEGWSMAAIRLPEPVKSIDVPSYDGKTNIRFYPFDIKALGSLLWSAGDFHTDYVGLRCDARGGGNLPECRDVNPGSWHLAVVNLVGARKKSFVMDATYDLEIWNQPVYSYEYRYFHGSELTDNLEVALIPVTSASVVRFIVGVSMNLTYIFETDPNTREASAHNTKTVNYAYDLELDENKNIVGGRWRKNPHPDFLWTVAEKSQARARGDSAIGNAADWDGKSPLPLAWRSAAAASSTFAQPLAAIVNRLADLARSAEP